MISKLGIVEEEADESMFWLEQLGESEIMPAARLKPLLDEFNEIVAMVVASEKTMKRNNPRSR